MDQQHRLVSWWLVAVLALTSTTACTSMRPVPPVTHPDNSSFHDVKPGDTVEIVQNNGQRARFVVAAADRDAIVARDGQRYARNEIVQMKRRSFSGAKTAGLVAGIAGGVFLMVAIAIADAVGSIWSS